MAECVQCVIERSMEAMSGGVLGSPVLPLAAPQAGCHAALRDVQTRYSRTILKERRRCQKSAEKGGAMDTTGCEYADPRSKIAKSRAQLESLVDLACGDAALFELDSCAQSSLVFLKHCTFGTVDLAANSAFTAFYALDAGAGATTTTFVGTVTTTTNTVTTVTGTTTTTVPSFALDCTLTFRVPTTARIGSLRYTADYSRIRGSFAGSGLAVQCTNLISGASKSFFDDEVNRVLRESVIAINGFNAPLNIASCVFETDDADLAASDFTVTVTEATTPDLQLLDVNVAISQIQCVPTP